LREHRDLSFAMGLGEIEGVALVVRCERTFDAVEQIAPFSAGVKSSAPRL
jgi:hypothetical protein